MHELSLAEQTLAIALDAARRQGATSIQSMHLRIGQWSGVEPEALRFALDVVLAGTCAEGATVTLESVAPACRCPDCGQEFEVLDFSYECPHCGRLGHGLIRGQEMDLVSMEVT